MAAHEIIGDLGKIVVFIILLLVFYLFTIKSENKLANRLFAVFLITTAIDLTGFFFYGWENFPNLYILKRASVSLQLPFFYFYALSLCFNRFRLGWRHLPHFCMFFIVMVLLKLNIFSEKASLFYDIALEIQYYAYIVSVFVTLYRYKKMYLDNYPSASDAVYKWLTQTTTLFLVGHMFVVARSLFPTLQSNDVFININIFISINVLFITSWFLFRALNRPHLFTEISYHFVEDNLLDEKKESPKSTLNVDIIRDNPEIRQLLFYMEESRPYLDSDLSLQKLSEQTKIADKELSMLINRNLDQHFFDFVNMYRINDAKAILDDPSQQHLTVSEILYAVGFNSKSSFYTAFKKDTNQTPKEYREKRTFDQ